MTRADVDRLFQLLAIYRPGDARADNKQLRAAWALVLEPYPPEAVREAVAAWFRECSWWPDVSDIARRCPVQPEAPRPSAAVRGDALRQREAQRSWFRRHREALQRAGLPTISAYLQQGGTYRDYYNLLEESGFKEEPYV